MNRLTNAGYNASEVQEVMNRLLNGNYTLSENDKIRMYSFDKIKMYK